MTKEIPDDQTLEKIEKEIIWSFTSIGTIKISELLFENKVNFLNEFFLGQHMGIFTDRRNEDIMTNFDIHKDRKDYFFNSEYKYGWEPFLRMLILGRIWEQFHAKSDKILINDIPAANFGANFIANSTPNAKFLIYLRDVRDIINDKIMMQQGQIFNGLNKFSSNDRMNLMLLEIKKWKKMIKMLLEIAKNYPQNSMIVKYEQIDEKETLKKIFQFVEIDMSENEISEKCRRIKNEKTNNLNKFGSWENNFSDEEKEVFKTVKDELDELGYLI